MKIKVAAICAAVLLGTMSHAALGQAPAAPAAGAPAPAVKAPLPPLNPAAGPTAAKAPKTAIGAKAPAPVNACKGLAEPDCGGKTAECSWIKAYATKAGKQVAGYCKSKPQPRAAKAAPAPKLPSVPASAVKAPVAPAAAAKTTVPAAAPTPK